MRVKIKDYQAIKDVDLTFEPGITAIVGNSNNGKSSIIRAIESAINNKGGSGFINYDADQCEVTIEDDGNEITWVKSNKQGKSHYIINGDKVEKIGQKQLPEVGELLNMEEVEVNNERFRLNFWKQMEYPFLVGKTPYQLFDFISKSNEQDLIKQYQDQSKAELKEVANEAKDLSSHIDHLTTLITSANKEREELEKFNDFDLDGFRENLDVATQLDKLMGSYEDSLDQVKFHKGRLDKANGKIKSISDLYNKVTKGISLYDMIRNAINSYKESTDNVTTSSESLKQSEEKIKIVSKKTKDLSGLIDKIKSTEELITKQSDAIHHYNLAEGIVEEQEKLVEDASTRIKEIEKELAEFSVCPFCGSELDENHKAGH